jgi:hypothetical protein
MYLNKPIPVTYTGRVTDDTGAPLHGVLVILSHHDWELGDHIKDWECRTGPDGSYRFDDVRTMSVQEAAGPKPSPHGFCDVVQAEAMGYAPVSMPVLPLSADTRRRARLFQWMVNNWPWPYAGEKLVSANRIAVPHSTDTTIRGLNLVLSREAVLTGRVVDTNGNPVPDYPATVSPLEAEKSAFFKQTYRERGLQSGRFGQFRVDQLAPGTHTFRRYLPELQRAELAINDPLTLAPAQQLNNYTLIVPNFQVRPEDFGTLRGQVTRNGRPSQHGYVTFPEVEISDTWSSTGGVGHYEVAFVPPGRQIVQFSMWLFEDHRGGAQVRERRVVDIEAGKITTLNIDFDERASILGDFRGLPDTHWFVQVMDDAMPGDEPLRASTWKFQKNGRYELPDLPPGVYRVVASCRSNEETVAEQTEDITLDAGESLRIDFDFLTMKP